MKTRNSMYPQMYRKDNKSYMYYTDFGKRIHLVAGQDGVTKEHIAALKEHHRKEVKADRYYNCYRWIGGTYKRALCSLDELSENTADELRFFMDVASDCETIYLEAEMHRELSEYLTKALSEMRSAERELFKSLWIEKEPISAIAQREGVTERAIRYRAARIVKFMSKRCKIVSILASGSH